MTSYSRAVRAASAALACSEAPRSAAARFIRRRVIRGDSIGSAATTLLAFVAVLVALTCAMLAIGLLVTAVAPTGPTASVIGAMLLLGAYTVISASVAVRVFRWQ
jgi:hypothetical protein